MSRLDELMSELRAAYISKDYANMVNIIQLELLDILKEKVKEE